MSVAADAALPFSNEVLNDPSKDRENINMILGERGDLPPADAPESEWEQMFASDAEDKAQPAAEEDKPQPPPSQDYADPFDVDDDGMDEDVEPAKESPKPQTPKPQTPLPPPKLNTPPASPAFAVPAPPTKQPTTAVTPASSTDTTPKKRLHRRRRRHHKSSESTSRSGSSKKKHRKQSNGDSHSRRRKRKRSALVDDEAEQSGTGSSDDEQLSEGSEFESISGDHDDDDEEDEEPSVSAYRALDSERSAEDVYKSDIVADHFFGDRFSEKVAFNIAQILKNQGDRQDAPAQQAYARALAGISTDRTQPVTCAAFAVSMIASVLAQSSQTDVDAIVGMIDKPLKRPWEEHAGNIFRRYSSDVYMATKGRVGRYMDNNTSSPFVAFAVTTQRPGISHASLYDDGAGKLCVLLRFKPMYAEPMAFLFKKMVEKRVLGPPGAKCDDVVNHTYLALLPSRIRRRPSDKFLHLPTAVAVAVPAKTSAKRKREDAPPPKQHYERHPLTITIDPITGQRIASDRGAFVYSIENQLRHLGSNVVVVPNETFVTLLRQSARCQQQSWFAHHVADNLLSDEPDKVARKLPFRWLLASQRLHEKSKSFVEARQFVKSHTDEQLEQHYDAFIHQLGEKQLEAYYALVHVLAGFLRCEPKKFRSQLSAPRIGKRKHRDESVCDVPVDTVLEINELPTERSFVLTADAERVYRLIFSKYLQYIGYEDPYDTADVGIAEASTARFLKKRQLFAARIDEKFNDDASKPGMIDLNSEVVDENSSLFVRSIYGFVVPIFDSIFLPASI